MKLIKKLWLLFFPLAIIILALVVFQIDPRHAEEKSNDASAAKPVSKVQTIQSDLQQRKYILNAPLIHQEPQLDRGCEVTSLAMMLNYAGVKVNKMTLADNIDKVPFKKDDYRGNPHDGFVGNIKTFSESGLGVYHEPLARLARQYLPNRIIDLSGESFDKVLDQIIKGHPVVVITNYTFKKLPDGQFTTWDTADGKVKITYYQHAVLVTGFDDKNIYFNNPLGGKNEKVDRDDFIAAWKQMGSQAISYN
ncbi:C39 family peptidase [Scopulibacillus cellulosilyticus]|uniref:C39 family peptidase n=1 Tax=Scopulibacillus cellulosilyticus TaxID=2665665 RepID=A0ABW2PWP2_9BACL